MRNVPVVVERVFRSDGKCWEAKEKSELKEEKNLRKVNDLRSEN